jgi:Sensors of blue-light using FAD
MNKNTQLVSLSYISNTVEEISFLGNLRLLAHSFLNNQKYNITGLLIYKNKQFSQVIEGEEAAIERIWSKIQRDTRHKDIQLLSKEPIVNRSFTKWSMLFPESEKVVKYFPDMVEAVNDLEMPVNHPLFKILAN